MEIIPTIWTSEIAEAQQKVQLLLDAGVKKVQLDVSDGKYVEKVTVMPEDVREMLKDLEVEVHLMVDQPINWVERCVELGAVRVIGQIEMMKDQAAFVDLVSEHGLEVGLALNIETPILAIHENVWVWLNHVLMMGYAAGVEGQVFQKVALEKIRNLRRLRQEKKLGFVIEVDGGVNMETIGEIVKAGADVVAAGGAVYTDGDVQGNLDRLQAVARETLE